jgi:hypothetical protein
MFINETKLGYKLFKVRKSGTIGSLFIDTRRIIPLNEWLRAEPKRKNGFSFRPGWHVCLTPHAPHLKTDGRMWFDIEFDDYDVIERPDNQGGKWAIAKWIKVLQQTTEGEITLCQTGAKTR